MFLGDRLKLKSILAYSFLTIGFLAGCVDFRDKREEEDGGSLPDLSPLSAERQMLNDMLPHRSVWVHSGHGSYNGRIQILTKAATVT